MTAKIKSLNKSNQACLMLVAGSLLIIACLAMVSIVDFGKPAQPTAETISSLDYATIRHNQKALTGVQWDEYDKSIRGKRVEWHGFINDIKPDITGKNYVWIDMDNPPDGVYDVFFPYPKDQSLDLSKGQAVTFRGEYDGGIEIIVFLVNLANAKIIY